MAFTQFPKEQYFRTLDSDQITRFGYFNLSNGTEIKHMMWTLYVNGPIPAPFQMRVNVYGNDEQASAIFSSQWAVISAATLFPTYTTNWLGNVYFDFPGYSLNPNINYFMSVETLGYTRNLDVFYIGMNLDWYSEVNNHLD